MKKPYIICHMMSSVDGRTLTAQWGKVKGMSVYEETGSKHKANAWMCGRITMEKDFAGNEPLKLKIPGFEIERVDFKAPVKAKSYAVAVDKDGKLKWHTNDLTGDHIISILTRSVSDKYLYHLQQLGISYIFAGEKEIDFTIALEKLYSLFKIKTLLLEGGGHLNGSLLDAGLIDELSFLHMPVADGIANTPTLFEISKSLPQTSATHLELLKIKKLKNDIIWMRYKVKR